MTITNNDTSLRLLFAKNFAKFIEDNSLLPVSGSRELTEITSDSGATETGLPNIWRGPKCKFYGVAFHKEAPKDSGGNFRRPVSYSYRGMIKVYSPKFIQVYFRSYINNYGSNFELVQFNNFVNALVFVDQHFVKNDRKAAYQSTTRVCT